MTRPFWTSAKNAGRVALKHIKFEQPTRNHGETIEGAPVSLCEKLDVEGDASAPIQQQSNDIATHAAGGDYGNGASVKGDIKSPPYTALRTKATRDKSPTQSDTNLTPPHDSSVPLTASSGRVGKLIIHIHRDKSRGFLHDKMIVIGVLSHQTWVSGEVLHFDVNVTNTSDKSIKRIEVSFVRTISAASDGIVSGQIATSKPINTLIKPLATWSWKKGHEGWNGVAPQTQIAKTWYPTVPAGQATTNERGIEASYSLAITIPCLIGKATTASVPIKVIAPNSLGRLRLEQRLRHSSRLRQPSSIFEISSEKTNIEQDTDQELETTQVNNAERDAEVSQGPSCNDMAPEANGQGSHPSPLKQNKLVDDAKASSPQGVFVSRSHIPKASDELLNEMLSNLSRSAKKANRKKRIIVKPSHLKQIDATQSNASNHFLVSRSQSYRASILKPLSTIGAHSRPKSTEDARQQAIQSTVVPSKEPTIRTSFDDFLRLEAQRKRCDLAGSAVEDIGLNVESNVWPLESTLPSLCPRRESHVGSNYIDCLSSPASDQSEDDESSIASETLTRSCSRSTLNADDLERFVRERRSFQAARRESANPFFKGSAGKERLRNAKYTMYQSLKERHEEKRRMEEILASQPYFVRRQQQHRRFRSGGSSVYSCHHPEGDFLEPIGSNASDQRRRRGWSENGGDNADDSQNVVNRRTGLDAEAAIRDISDGHIKAGRRYSSRYGRLETWRHAGQRTLF